jgi:hypothetical protein
MKRIFNIALYIFAAIGVALSAMYVAVKIGLTNTSGIVDNQHNYFKAQVLSAENQTATTSSQVWMRGQEWDILKQAVAKDKDPIDRASVLTGIPSRLIVAPLVVEQLRLFHTNRELFKDYFAPLKMLGDQSQFSWGVMGMKQDTAKVIENNLKDSNSPWYLGPQFSNILDFSTTTAARSPDEQRFYRLTDEHDRYYSYLYAALYIKELLTQWQNSGFPIDSRPEIIATLFNIGFTHSHPSANPQVGGVEIDIGTTTYSFGGLAGSFYYSNELTDIFPR